MQDKRLRFNSVYILTRFFGLLPLFDGAIPIQSTAPEGEVHPMAAGRNFIMKRVTKITSAALAAVAGLWGFAGQTQAQLDIHIGVVIPAPVVVVPVEVVGLRRPLYDADLRLRIAQASEWNAHEALEAARAHEGDVAGAFADAQGLVADLRLRMVDVDVEGLRRRLEAVNHRIDAAAEDLKASHELHDQAGAADATARLAKNQAEADGLRDEIARAGASESARLAFHDAEIRAAQLNDELAAAHDAVYDAQVRFATAHDWVCAALHDRDESLWIIYRDQLITGVFDPAVCGFTLDLGYFHGRLPRDPELLHAYFVHDVGYWNAHPDLIVVRMTEVNRIKEIATIREVERVRDVVHVTEVEKVEKVVKVEDIKKIHETVTVARTRVTSERTERETASKEGRKPDVTKFVAEAHPAVAEKLTHPERPSGASPSTPAPDSRDKHDAHDTATPTPAADPRAKHDAHDTGTSTTPPDTTGGRHHDTGSATPSTPSTPTTPDTGGRRSRGSSGDTSSGTPSTPTPTPTPDSRSRHDSGSGTPSTPTPTSRPTDTGGRHHDSGTPSTPSTPPPPPPADTGSVRQVPRLPPVNPAAGPDRATNRCNCSA
jgi:hypothetical protein